MGTAKFLKSMKNAICATLATRDSISALYFPTMEKLERVIAALEVEAAMIESHANKLFNMVPNLKGSEQQRQLP